MAKLRRTDDTGTHLESILHLNRNKRSIALDLKKPAAHEALLKILAIDALVQSGAAVDGRKT